MDGSEPPAGTGPGCVHTKLAQTHPVPSTVVLVLPAFGPTANVEKIVTVTGPGYGWPLVPTLLTTKSAT